MLHANTNRGLMKIVHLILILSSLNSFSQNIYFKSNGGDTDIDNKTFVENIKLLNQKVLHGYSNNDTTKFYDNVFRFYILDGDYKNGLYYLNKLKNVPEYKMLDYNEIIGVQFELYALAKLDTEKNSFSEKYANVFNKKINSLTGSSKFFLKDYFINKEQDLKIQISKFLNTDIVNDNISTPNAIKLCRYYIAYLIAKETNNIAKTLIENLDKQSFSVKDSIIITTKKGKEITLYYVLNKKINQPKPSILNFSTYIGNNDYFISSAKINADRGYNIIYAFSRGIYLSKDEITPFEFEVEDVNEVIDWISKQTWSNGKVGMIGGSYDGFSQWAATKNLHPALKTIIPSASVGFGIDFPMYNNCFSPYMLRWLTHVKKETDFETFDNEKKWLSIYNKYYKTGIAFNKLDNLYGGTNHTFQKWLKHPSFDSYWQSKLPYKKDFTKINIPILTITGYYDADQRGAMYYYNNHLKYNKDANHYFVIGPYGHSEAVSGITSDKYKGYKIDSVANIDLKEISFQWFDYILRGQEKPEFIKDKVNYQVMGTNKWKSAPSVDKISNKKLKFFLNKTKLEKIKPSRDFIIQDIDFAKRKDTLQSFNDEKILDSVIYKRDLIEKLVFESEAFNDSFEINGSFTGNLKASINKKDMDITINIYEKLPNGQYFKLTHEHFARASYSKDNTTRNLLKPNKIETIPIKNTFFTSKKIEKGSKLIILLGVRKSPDVQINYGTGKDVSEETIVDAKEPLEIKWYNDSYIEIPIMQE